LPVQYLTSRVFVIPANEYEVVNEKLNSYAPGLISANTEDETILYVILQTRNLKTVENIIGSSGGKTLDIPEEDISLKDFLQNTGENVRKLQKELEQLKAELQSQVQGDIRRIVLLREALVAENDRLAVLEQASESKHLTVIDGWIPARDSTSVISMVRENLPQSFIETRKPQTGEAPPSKLKNNGPIKPFELIVKIF